MIVLLQDRMICADVGVGKVAGGAGGGGAEGYKPISRLILIDRVVRWHSIRKATEEHPKQKIKLSENKKKKNS